MYGRSVPASRRFLKTLGYSLVQAALFGSLVGLLVYFRVPRAAQGLGDDNLRWHQWLRQQLEDAELWFYDWRVRDLGQSSSRPEQVVLVAVDEETLANARTDEHPGIAVQPWPREIVGGVVDRLLDEGASLVVLDEPFSDSSPSTCSLPGPKWPTEAQSDDTALRSFLDRRPGQSVLPFRGVEGKPPSVGGQLRPYLAFIDHRSSAAEARELVRRILSDRRPAFVIPDGQRVRVWAGATTEEEGRIAARRFDAATEQVRELTAADRVYQVTPLDLLISLGEVQVEGLDPAGLTRVRSLVHPIAPLLGDKSRYGNISLPADHDGRVRGIPHLLNYVSPDGKDHVLPSAPLAAVMRLAGARELRYAAGRLQVGDHFSIPMDESGFSLLRWDAAEGGRDGRGALKRVLPAWRVVVNMFDKIQGVPPHHRNDLGGRAVVLTRAGGRAAALRTTPIGQVAGGAILGQALANLLVSEGISRAEPRTDLLAVLGMAFVGAFLALTFTGRPRPARGVRLYLLGLVIAGGAYLWFAWHVFLEDRVWIAVAGPLLAMVATFTFTVLYARRSEQRVLEFVYAALGRASSAEVTRKVASDLSLMRPDRRSMTVLTLDIEGFGALAVQLTPQRLVELLNEYWSEATAAVHRNQGQVDKYVGDALTAFWGAPLRTDRHAHFACEAMLQMREALARRQADWEERFGHQINFRAGIDTGQGVVGDMGSNLKPHYTVMGEVVRRAARLERESRVYGTPVLVGEGTARACGDRYLFREVDRVRMSGESLPVLLFELIGRREGDARPEPVALFERGLLAYHQRRFLEALEIFTRCAEEFQDPVAALYVRRCDQYLDVPPPKEWDGVYELGGA